MLRPAARTTVSVDSAVVWGLGLLWFWAPIAFCQTAPIGQQSLPVVRELSKGETIHFVAPPPVDVEFPIRCDGDGDIFVAYSANPYAASEGEARAITKILPDSKSTVEFGMPSIDGYDSQNRQSFAVGPNGGFYALISAHRAKVNAKRARRPDYFIEKFKEDGTRDSLTKLVLPAGAAVLPMLFGVFNNGTYLVTGTVVRHAKSQAFTAIFDSSGRWVKSLRLAGDVPPAPVFHSPPPPPKPSANKDHHGNGSSFLAVQFGGVVSAADGNMYLVRASDPIKIYGISAGGEVVNQAEAPIPEPGLSLTEVGASAAGLYLQFSHIPTNGPSSESPGPGPRDMVGLFDVTIKRYVGLYTLPANVSQDWVPACADNQGNFSFLGEGADARLQVTTYLQH